MAWLQVRNGSWRVLFRYAGKPHTLWVGEVEEKEAQAVADKVDGPYVNRQILLKSGQWGLPSEDGTIYDATVHPNVVAHWRTLAAAVPEPGDV